MYLCSLIRVYGYEWVYTINIHALACHLHFKLYDNETITLHFVFILCMYSGTPLFRTPLGQLKVS